MVTNKRRALENAMYIRSHGEGFRKSHDSGKMRMSKIKLGSKGIERKDNAGCFFGRNEVKRIILILNGKIRS